MKKVIAGLLQVGVVLLGLGALAFLLWEPHVEGRNLFATTFEIYFKDPFLAYVYVGSTPFFIGLGQTFKLLGHFRWTGAFAEVTVNALRNISRCALALIGVVIGGLVFILKFGDPDDRPAGVFLSALVILTSSFVAIASAISGRVLRNALIRSGGRGG